jgi:DedD protein
MDRQLIERMTGGVVLMLLLVVIAPALLDGRPGDGDGLVANAEADSKLEFRTIRIATPARASERSAEKPREAAVRLPKPAPVAAVVEPIPAKTVDKSPVKVIEPVPVKAPAKPVKVAQATAPTQSSLVAKKPPPAQSTPPIQVRLKGEEAVWAVQLGSFSSKDNANKLARSIGSDGFESFVSRVVVAGKTMYRVQVGPRRTREDAEQLGRTLSKAGHSGKVVPLAPSEAD